MPIARRTCTVVAWWILATTVAASGGAAAQVSGPAGSTPLLDVPYLTQTEALCGGAAAAMVLRYWGAPDVFAEDFAPLVDRAAGGIATSALGDAIRQRGWQVLTTSRERSTIAAIAADVGRRRPVVGLIDVGAAIHHYVVVVAVTPVVVVLHDPAQAPFRVMPIAEFERRWTGAGRWMMTVLPATAPVPASAPAAIRERAPDAPAERTCDALVRQGVAVATIGDVDEATRGFEAATRLCPGEAAGWRELAGLRFLASQWTDAGDLAARAVLLDPDDEHAAQILATSRYLAGDRAGALAAWNRVGEPRIDGVRVHGLIRTREPVAVARLGLAPRGLLTPASLSAAARRLDELPAAASARVQYTSIDGGLATVEGHVIERDVAPRAWPAFAAIGVRAITLDEVRVDIASPTGGGDVWTGAWRWSERRPRIAFSLEAPAPGAPSANLDLSGAWERQSYRFDPDTAVIRAERRTAGVGVSRWATGRLWWRGGLAYERFDRRRFVSLQATIDHRWLDDRVAIVAAGASWAPVDGGAAFSRGDARIAWRTDPAGTTASWSGGAGVSLASRQAPLATWAGASADRARDGVLRAHRLLDRDVISGDVFGRRLVFGGLEHERRLWSRPVGRIGVAFFADAARAFARETLARPASRLHVDVGAGLRLRAPAFDGAIRLDVAYDVRDGDVVASAGVLTAWPWR